MKVKNWDKFQHYKDRNPPWIKLATDLFQNYDFSCLQDASKLLAVCIWTVASRTKDGSFPNDFDYLKRQCNLGNMVKLEHYKELISKGYFILDSDTLAGCTQSATPETEAYNQETEGETETKPPLPPKGKLELALEEFASFRKKIKSPLTEKAMELTKRELEKFAPGDDDMKVAIIERSIMRGWKGVFPLDSEVKTSSSKHYSPAWDRDLFPYDGPEQHQIKNWNSIITDGTPWADIPLDRIRKEVCRDQYRYMLVKIIENWAWKTKHLIADQQLADEYFAAHGGNHADGV